MARMLEVGLGALLGLLVGCSGGGDEVDPPPVRRAPVTPGSPEDLFVRQVEPILRSNCYRCHGGLNHRGGLNLQTRAGMMKGGKSGADVIPGDPERSLLVTLMRHQGPANHPMPMPPPPRPKLSDAEIARVARWVKEGAMMPADEEKP